MKNPDISIIIPAFNEEKSIGKVIKKIKTAFKKTSFKAELIIVDDASTDSTAKTAKKQKVKVITNFKNLGPGASFKKGVNLAQAKYVGLIDADNSYEPKDFPKMLELCQNFDQVIGHRKKEAGTFKLLRIPAKWFIRILASYLTQTKIPDLNSGYRVLRKEVLLKYLWLLPDGFSYVSTSTMAFLSNNHPTTWLKTNYYKRIGKSKFHPLKDTYNYLLTIIKIIMYFNPLRIFLPLAIFLFLIGIIKSLIDYFFIIHRLQLSDIIIILSSILIAILGLIADLIVTVGKSINQNIESHP